MTKPEPTAEVKKGHIIEALGLLGFEKIMELYVKPHKEKIKIVVDLRDGKKSVYFRDGKTEIREDDQDGTLIKISNIIIDAEKGIMPSQPAQDVGQEHPMPVPSHQQTQKKKVPEQKEITNQKEQNGYTPAEIIHNPAAPVQEFQPQGMMIMDILPRLAEFGGIKIGGKGEERKGKSGQPYRLPVKYDHFVIKTKQKDEHGDYTIDPIMKTWGFNGTVEDGPVELDIYLLYNDVAANFMTSYRQYKGGKCLCSGNGIDAIKADGTKIQCNTSTCPIFDSKQCKPNGILSVILKDAPTLGGVYKFRTTSIYSIQQILSSLHLIKSATGGYLANIPLKMTLTPKTVNPTASPTAQTVYIVNIIFPGNAEELHKTVIELVRERASMRQEILNIEAQARLAICAPESKEEMEEIEFEFYPNQQEA
ncbi:MAG: recombination directionality factor [Methanosarcinaceae archaeon]